MDDLELFELCEEVYELELGWEFNGDYFVPDIYSSDANAKAIASLESIEKDRVNGWLKLKNAVPLYTSDYLLEKLPFEEYDLFLATNPGVGWWVESFDNEVNIPRVDADTPLKALLKLTIALKEAGEL